MPLIVKAERLDPSNPEVFLVAAAMYRFAWRWDDARDAIRIARRLDPLTPFYLDREATIELCASRPQAALRLWDAELAMSPFDAGAKGGRARVMAWLGKPDSGYWDAQHADGKRRLAALQAAAATQPASPFAVMQATFASGDSLGGYAMAERLSGDGDPRCTSFRVCRNWTRCAAPALCRARQADRRVART